MNIAIMKDTICINIAVFNAKETAQSFLESGVWADIEAENIMELPEGFGIGDSYIGGEWVKSLPDQPLIDLNTAKQQAIAKTKQWVTRTLETPIEHNGKLYTVTMEKQNLLSAQLGMYMMNTQAGIPYQLTWNAAGEVCTPWEFADLLALSNTIAAHVQSVVKRQQDAEMRITAAESEEQINEVLADFV